MKKKPVEILPCKCGNPEPSVALGTDSMGCMLYRFVCELCGRGTLYFPTENKAAEKWNEKIGVKP